MDLKTQRGRLRRWATLLAALVRRGGAWGFSTARPPPRAPPPDRARWGLLRRPAATAAADGPALRSGARRDPDLDDDDVGGGSPPSRHPRRGGSGDEEDNDDVGNEDLSLEIVARVRWRRSGPPGLADLLQVSSGDEAGEDAVVELGEAEEPRRKQRKKHRKEAAEAAAAAFSEEQKEVGGTKEGPIGTAESVLTEDGADVPAFDNMVLRKLLGQDCFICKKGGHMAKDHPDKHKRNDHQSTLCLRCGEIGHDMFGCTNGYPPDDIEQIRCYVCNQNGHLCCFDVADNCPKQISCYNCAKSGHSGLASFYAYKLLLALFPYVASHGRQVIITQSEKGKMEKRIPVRDQLLHDARKTSKRKSPHFEDKMDIPQHKSKARGGWTGGDDLGDLPFKKYKSNGWGSPSTPKKPYTNHQISDGDYFTPVLMKAQPWLRVTELELFTQCKEACVFVKIRCQQHPCPKYSLTLDFYETTPPPTSLDPDGWLQHKRYGGPDPDEKHFQLFSIFIV
ncbi:zinc finger CCHC domain-containing protein 7-like [Panicum miliaceum]|uniref:Zinc finger CCHC domain-containing protein 7-like n=1 Tax=Panicum miliaceum TaxID=4540 RepID=A0A3L6PZI7_PANMI|nr:zinc finger CCHC domain-containing protein 7-like [Panicum miliaceum]